MLKVKVISLPYIVQVLYVLCFTRPRYHVSVYRTIGPLFLMIRNWAFYSVSIIVKRQNKRGKTYSCCILLLLLLLLLLPLLLLLFLLLLLIIIISSPEPLGSQGELIVYPCSGVRPSSSVVRPQFQPSSPLKPLGQSKPNFMWSLFWKGEQKFV